jgi:hypothetical protein
MQPTRESFAVIIKLARTAALRVLGVKLFGVEVLAYGVARKSRSAGYISNRPPFSEMPTANYTD